MLSNKILSSRFIIAFQAGYLAAAFATPKPREPQLCSIYRDLIAAMPVGMSSVALAASWKRGYDVCRFEKNDLCVPLTAEETRASFSVDAKTGKPLAPESHVTFVDFS